MANVIGPSKPRYSRELAEGSQTYVLQVLFGLSLDPKLAGSDPPDKLHV